MFSNLSGTTILIASAVSLNVYQYMRSCSLKREGYEQAKTEFYTQMHTSAENSMKYAEKNAQIVKSGKKFDYMDSTAQLWALPKWNLKVFGETYVVRMPHKCDYTQAFILPKKDNDALEAIFYTILTTKYSESTLENLQREAKKNIYQSVNDIPATVAPQIRG